MAGASSGTDLCVGRDEPRRFAGTDQVASSSVGRVRGERELCTASPQRIQRRPKAQYLRNLLTDLTPPFPRREGGPGGLASLLPRAEGLRPRFSPMEPLRYAFRNVQTAIAVNDAALKALSDTSASSCSGLNAITGPNGRMRPTTNDA